MKTMIVTFGRLSKKKGKTGANLLFEVAKTFFDNDSLDKILCLGYDKTIDIPECYITCPSNIFKRVFSLFGYFGSFFLPLPSWKIKEWLVERWFIKKLQYADNVLFLKPVFPPLVQKAKNLGMRVILLVNIVHPKFTQEMMKRLEVMLSIKSESLYSSENRVNRLHKTFCNSDSLLLINSEFVKNTYRENKITTESINVLRTPIGIPINHHRPKNCYSKNGNLIFLTLAYLSLIKGVTLLLNTWREIEDNLSSDVRLIVAGLMDTDIKKFAQRYEFPNVSFLGYVIDLEAVYHKSDVFILSSVSDYSPATAIEAMANGLSLIMSLHCGISDFIESGVQGFTYPPFATDKLKELITWFDANREKIPEMGKNSLRLAKKFDISKFAQEVYGVVNDVNL